MITEKDCFNIQVKKIDDLWYCGNQGANTRYMMSARTIEAAIEKFFGLHNHAIKFHELLIKDLPTVNRGEKK